MWRSTLEPRLLSPPVAVPVSPLASYLLPSDGLHDVMQQWHLHTGLNSLSSVMRVIGYLLVITTSGLEVPHIIKVLKSRNCDGISILSVAQLLHATSANIAYCIYRDLPLSSWAESVPLMAQYVTLMCLLLLYQGRERDMLVFAVLYVLLMLPLLLGLVPGHMVCYFLVLTLPLTFLGKVSHIRAAHKRGSSGQMSKTSIFLLNLRSMGRLLTSLFDTRDTLLVVCYAHACVWNTLITCQTVYQRHERRRKIKEERLRSRNKESEKVRVSETSGSESESELGLERVPKRRSRYNSFTLNNDPSPSP